jgi:hypothetical protein
MSEELPFDPFPFLDDPHQQTILSSFLHVLFDPISECKIVPLADGDKLSIEITTPEGWKLNDVTVVMIHGLCGSHQSPYVVRMTKKLEPERIRVARVNLRGCGSSRGLAKRMYHAGRSEDLLAALKVLKEESPDSTFILIGYSLGGALVLKIAGELGPLAKIFFKKVIAINPPIDLHASVVRIGRPENSLYENYFIKLLRDDVHYRHGKFKDLPPVRLPENLKMYEFDQIYTAPYYGFRNAHDYYQKCTALHMIDEIALSCKVLLSEDDPLISSTTLDDLLLPSNIEVFKTKKGGHMGYLGNPKGERGLYWLDSLLMDWILKE